MAAGENLAYVCRSASGAFAIRTLNAREDSERGHASRVNPSRRNTLARPSPARLTATPLGGDTHCQIVGTTGRFPGYA